jgi:hypothetical protein
MHSLLRAGLCGLVILLIWDAAPLIGQNPRAEKLKLDRRQFEDDGYWIYNDFDRAIREAAASNRPIIAVLRCIPCEECVKLDDEWLKNDPELRLLLDQYVRVRLISTNGLDLSLFQFDYDQSFAAFLLNADGTIYGRFGTRSHRTEWEDDVSVAGLRRALQCGLELHAGYPENESALRAKRGPQPPFPTPESFPSLSPKYASSLDLAGDTVRSCIHCHQIGDAIKDNERRSGRMSASSLFPHPHPKSLGLTLDPDHCAVVRSVDGDSPAARAGFRPGDELIAFDGQRMISIADVQWVLHTSAPDRRSITATVFRDNGSESLVLELPNGWREQGDLSWRASSWELRRMVLGGMLLETRDPRSPDLPAEGMALRIKHVGQYSPHDEAKKAGILAGDILVSYDGRSDFASESQVLSYGIQHFRPGDQVVIRVLRDGNPIEVSIPVQP